MGKGSVRLADASAPRVRFATANPAGTSASRHMAGWETRLFAGLRIERGSHEAHAALVRALGETGVEAEYFLSLVRGLPVSPPSRAAGELFLAKLEAAGHRLRRVAASLEVATQGYRTTLASVQRELPGEGDVWWPAPADAGASAEPLELWLRRCGYAYRQVVAVHLAANVEAICEQLALTLHALATLPPAGTLPVGTLCNGLDELTSGLQGHIVPMHLVGLSAHTPGLLAGIAQLRRLDALEETSLESDIAWATERYGLAQQVHPGAQGGQGGTPPAIHPRSAHAPAFWAAAAAQEWRETIAALERLRRR